MPNFDKNLEKVGAEFLVLGNLLIESIQSYKTYTNFPGYDIVATNPATGRSCRIQVKSRRATDHDPGFLINNFECDFVVIVSLNRGYSRPRKSKPADTGRRDPDYHVLPVEVARAALYEKSRWPKVSLTRVLDLPTYRNNWALIKQFLGGEEEGIDAARSVDLD